MAKPTSAILPIENGRLVNNLDANNKQIVNLDTSNLSIGGGGGGNDTGTTTAILKGDGNHGFADAVADSDYATPATVALKEDASSHETDVAGINTSLGLLTDDVNIKASTADLTAGLALKADATDLSDYITSNNAAVALKAAITDVNDALDLKADSTALTAGLALKEDLLPTTANDGWILARHNDDTWYFVDPVTLGTTNQSFSDGVSNTDTSWVSATANFTADDVGLGITGTDIQPGTTIASRTNSTTIVLSQATTGTGTGRSFTLLNRLTITTSSGTVTSVSDVDSDVGQLFTTSITNPTTSPTVTYALSTTTLNSFWGTTGASSRPTYLNALQAKVALGGTTVGQAFFGLSNVSVISYPQIQANNTILTRTPAQTLSDIGGESALTFSAPLARSTNTISIPAATDLVSGYLTFTDHLAFNGKLSSSRKLTTTAPMTIAGVSNVATDLSADRTIAMAQATANANGTGLVDGYLRGADFFTFLDKPPNSRQIAVTAPLTIGGVSGGSLDLSANRTIAIPQATATADGYLSQTDFKLFAAGAGASGTTVTVGSSTNFTIPVQTPPVTRVIFNQTVIGNIVINLPPTAGYGSTLNYPYIEFVDIIQGGAFSNIGQSVTLTPTVGNLIDGATTYTMPRGMGYLRINSNGLATGSGRWATAKYFVDTFKDATIPTNAVNVAVTGAGTLTLASGNSVTVQPFAGTAIGVSRPFLSSISSVGVPVTSNVYSADILSNQDDIVTIVGNSHVVDNPGVSGNFDNIRLSVNLTTSAISNLFITLPMTSDYNNGQAIFFYDAAGGVGPANTVTLVPTSGDTVNGGSGVVLNRPFDSRRITANPSTNNWTVESYGGSVGNGLNVGGFTTLTDALIITATCDQNLTEQHWSLTGTSLIGLTRTLRILNAREGEKFRLNYTHYTTNDTVVIENGGTPNNGLGLLTLSTAGAATLDSIVGTAIAGGKFVIDNPTLNLTYAAPASYNTLADAGPSNTGAASDTIGAATGNKYRGYELLATSSYVSGRIDFNLRAQGTPANLTGNIILEVCSDAVRSVDAGAVVTAGSNTVTNATTVLANDVGQIVTSSISGFPSPAYISTVTAGVSFTLVTTKGGATPVTIPTSGTGVNIFGKPGTVLATGSIVASSITNTSFQASNLWQQFTGFTASIINGTTYWMVLHADAPLNNNTDYVLVKGATGGSNTGWKAINGASFPPSTPSSSAEKANFNTYKAP